MYDNPQFFKSLEPLNETLIANHSSFPSPMRKRFCLGVRGLLIELLIEAVPPRTRLHQSLTSLKIPSPVSPDILRSVRTLFSIDSSRAMTIILTTAIRPRFPL